MISSFENICWGSHTCYFYENKANYLKVLALFFKEGLENNEYCIWVLPENITEQEIIEYFLKNNYKIKKYLEEEHLKFYNYQQWYNKIGSFNTKDIIDSWLQNLKNALKKGYSGIRITGDVCLISKEDLEAFLGYELQLNSMIKEKFIKAICTYPIFKYQKFQILDIASAHFSVLIDINDTQRVIQHNEIKTNLKAKEILKTNLQNLQRIESMGLLSGGIIHDFKKSITIIRNNIDLALRKMDNGMDATKYLKGARSIASDVSKDITELFSYGQLTEMKIDISANQIITKLVNLLNNLISEGILIEMDLSQNLWNIQGDPGKIERILVNLINNARDAMPAGGKITIMTKNFNLDKSKKYETFTLTPGNYITLSVKDTGIGMNNSILPHIFEPFFTTKNSDKGTGLGLPMVYSYLNDFEGKIEVFSKSKKGTTFKIYIPVKES